MEAFEVPAWGIKIDENDRIILRFIAGTEDFWIQIRIRHMTLDGMIQTSKYTFYVTAPSTLYTQTIILAPGYLVSLDIITDASVARYGLCFARATMCRLENGSPRSTIELASGAITDITSVSWPTIEPKPGGDTLGFPMTTSLTNPAPGANMSYTVPSRTQSEVRAIKIRFTTDATVATRRMILRINPGGSLVFEYVCTITQAASLVYDYVFAPFGAPEVLAGTTVMCPIPILPLSPLDVIATAITNIQAADDISLPMMLEIKKYTL